MVDHRHAIYRDLHGTQLSSEAAQTVESARTVLKLLFDGWTPRSMLDVGCGIGAWMRAASGLGVDIVKGVDGPWFDPAKALVDVAAVQTTDLEKPFDLATRFDLVVCIEVAEHLSAEAADLFVAQLVRHAPVVLFSAAIPFQGGHHHVNEQYLPYWAEKFAAHAYQPIDFIRPRIWTDTSVHSWLRQNIVVFADRQAVADIPALARHAAMEGARPAALSVILPEVYHVRAANGLKAQERWLRLLNFVGGGGLFRLTPSSDGGLTIRRHEPRDDTPKSVPSASEDAAATPIATAPKADKFNF